MPKTLHIPSRNQTWRLMERLGRGGSAVAWRARRSARLLDDEVCVKVPLGRFTDEERKWVLEEARVLSLVRHSNVVSLLDVVEDAHERPVLVLELVRGLDLARLRRAEAERGRSFSPDVVASIGRALCLALAAAQRAVPGGVVHRDVTPQNILISSEGEVKLTDFGIARVLTRNRWTQSGHIKGKLGYVAPEIVRQERCNARTDVFSVGVVLFELLTGALPFPMQDAVETLAAVAAGQRFGFERFAQAVPPELARIVDWMLAHDPSSRPDPFRAARALSTVAYEQRATETLASRVRRHAARIAKRPNHVLRACKTTWGTGADLLTRTS